MAAKLTVFLACLSKRKIFCLYQFVLQCAVSEKQGGADGLDCGCVYGLRSWRVGQCLDYRLGDWGIEVRFSADSTVLGLCRLWAHFSPVQWVLSQWHWGKYLAYNFPRLIVYHGISNFSSLHLRLVWTIKPTVFIMSIMSCTFLKFLIMRWYLKIYSKHLNSHSSSILLQNYPLSIRY